MSQRWLVGALVVALVGASACRGKKPATDGETIAHLVDSLVPAVEKATGLRFRTPPRSAP